MQAFASDLPLSPSDRELWFVFTQQLLGDNLANDPFLSAVVAPFVALLIAGVLSTVGASHLGKDTRWGSATALWFADDPRAGLKIQKVPMPYQSKHGAHVQFLYLANPDCMHCLLRQTFLGIIQIVRRQGIA
jgi:hypothetical protein